MNTQKKNFLGFASITLALVMVLGAAFSLGASGGFAGAEAMTDNTVIVTSPFTAAVQKVHGSVVGINNYTTYRPNNNYYGFGFGFGFGNGYGNGYGNDYGNVPEDSNRQVLQGSGSGVVVAEGYVLTNYHVVEDATTLEVTAGESVYPAQLMGTDEGKDLAVLYVDGLTLEPVALGDSDTLIVGDWAICIGNPLSFTGTTTVGVISALNREVTGKSTDAYGKRTTNTMIQTDAAINSGNSGGGMFNVAGELIGIPSMKYSSSGYSQASVEGIGMAIPVNVAKPLIENVLAGKGNVQSSPNTASITSAGKPRIGVTISNMNTSHYAVANGLLPNGVYISNVEEDAPADEAGIEIGDIVVEIDGNIITSTQQMTSYIQTKTPGDTVNVKVYRVDGGLNNVEGNDIPNGKYIDLTVKLALLDDIQQ